jgi:hypothetical protein
LYSIIASGSPESEGDILMNMGTTLAFNLPNGWTLRKVATALAREWLPPFRAVPVEKGASWLVQPIMEETDESEGPLWEPGISTVEYERRLDRPGLGWAVRAKSNRGKTSKAMILARFTMRADQPDRFEMVCAQDSLPDTLFDAEKLGQFLANHSKTGADGLFAGLLIEHGFQLISV